jgi:hypothetical protein
MLGKGVRSSCIEARVLMVAARIGVEVDIRRDQCQRPVYRLIARHGGTTKIRRGIPIYQTLVYQVGVDISNTASGALILSAVEDIRSIKQGQRTGSVGADKKKHRPHSF